MIDEMKKQCAGIVALNEKREYIPDLISPR